MPNRDQHVIYLRVPERIKKEFNELCQRLGKSENYLGTIAVKDKLRKEKPKENIGIVNKQP